MAGAERFSLKDHLFNQEKVTYLAGLFTATDPTFDAEAFTAEVMTHLSQLGLKQRISLISDVLGNHLPDDFEAAAALIAKSLPPPLDPSLTDGDFGDFIIAPIGQFIVDHGLAHYETSMVLLHELTQRFSMEGPIRPFIEAFPHRTMKLLAVWAEDPNYHVRRLVSEGTRHRLPWAPRISLPIDAPLPLLDKLHADPTRYVTRSVANHMNDIAKVEPTLVIDMLRRWKTVGEQRPDELEWMIRHSLRTLIKQGHAGAMDLLGFSTDPKIHVDGFRLVPSGEVAIGGQVGIEIDLTADAPEKLVVDYSIEFVKKRGTSTRVFKLKQVELEAGETVSLAKTHKLKANASTFTLLPGAHRVAIQINGNEMASDVFELVEAT